MFCYGVFVGLPNQEKQLQPVDILLPLVYAAAETGAKQFIEIFFCLPVAKMVFEEYKNNFVLPEHIAEGNGHEEIATYLRDITKRYMICFVLFFVRFFFFGGGGGLFV